MEAKSGFSSIIIMSSNKSVPHNTGDTALKACLLFQFLLTKKK